MKEQRHQLSNQTEAVQSTCPLSPALQIQTLDSDSRDGEEDIQAFEMKCFWKLLHISWTKHTTKASIRLQVAMVAGTQESLLATVKRRKLLWFGHVTRHDTRSKTTLQGTLDYTLQGTLEGGRCRGRERKSWTENIEDWTSQDLPALTQGSQDKDGDGGGCLQEHLSCPPPPQPTRPRH